MTTTTTTPPKPAPTNPSLAAAEPLAKAGEQDAQGCRREGQGNEG
ncbi:hypothetical protein [Streptomyces sp. NPDC059597]